jgi:hypothetical protein
VFTGEKLVWIVVGWMIINVSVYGRGKKGRRFNQKVIRLVVFAKFAI